MPDDVLALADRLWRGELGPDDYHPVSHLGGLAEICDGVAFVPSFANVSAVRTGDGLVLVDTGSSFVAAAVHDELRRWNSGRLNTAVYSHGHIDHVFGVPVWEAESAEHGWPAPVVVAHEALPRQVRPVHHDGRVQRGDQPAAVRRGRVALAGRVPVSGPHLRHRADPGRRRRELRAAAREGRDRRPHGDLGCRPAGAVLRRPVHLGLAQRGKPAEGAAVPAGMGRRAAPHDRARGRVPAARARAAGHRRATGSGRR